MRGSIVALAMVLLLSGITMAQEDESQAEGSGSAPGQGVLVIGLDAEEYWLTESGVLVRTTELGEDTDFVIEWGDNRDDARRDTRARVWGGEQTYYRTVPFNISIFSPVEIFPFEDKQVMGTAVSILYGSTASLIGLQVGVVNHVSDRLYGIQAGVACLCDGVSYGIRAGYITTMGGRHGGISVGGLYHRYTEDGTWGLMIGGFNRAEQFTGLQIGVINYSSHLRGVQIGAVNINPDGRLPFTLGINFGW